MVQPAATDAGQCSPCQTRHICTTLQSSKEGDDKICTMLELKGSHSDTYNSVTNAVGNEGLCSILERQRIHIKAVRVCYEKSSKSQNDPNWLSAERGSLRHIYITYLETNSLFNFKPRKCGFTSQHKLILALIHHIFAQHWLLGDAFLRNFSLWQGRHLQPVTPDNPITSSQDYKDTVCFTRNRKYFVHRKVHSEERTG